MGKQRHGLVLCEYGLSVEAVDIRQRTVSVAESKKETNGVRDICSGAGEEMTSAAMKAISDVCLILLLLAMASILWCEQREAPGQPLKRSSTVKF